MARYTIDAHPGGMTIRVTEAGADRPRILAALGECQEGRCGCPTDEYEKLDTMTVSADHEELVVGLVPQAGLELDPAEIDACLRFTIGTE